MRQSQPSSTSNKYLSYLSIICFMFLILTIAIPHHSWAESLSDLEKQLETISGKEKVDLLNQLADKYISIDIEKSTTYADEAITEAEKIKYVRGEIDGYNQLGYISVQQGIMEDALLFFKEASQRSTENDYPRGLAFSQNGFGIIWGHMGDYAKSLENFETAMATFNGAKDTKGVAFVKNNIGTIYESIGAYDKSVTFYQEALQIYEDLKLDEEIAVTLTNLGSVNSSLQNFDEAIQYYQEGLKINETLGLKNAVATGYNNMGDLSVQKEDFKAANEFYDKALALAKEMNSKRLMGEVETNLGYLSEAQEDYADAKLHYDTAQTLFTEINDSEGSITALNNLGSLMSKQRSFDKALSYHLESFERSKASGYKAGLKAALKNIAVDYQDLGNFEESNNYFALYSELSDRFSEEAVAKSFADSEVLYESEKKNKEIQKQKETLILKEQERNRLLMIMGLIVGFLIVVAFLLVWVAKERKKSEKLLLNILPKKVAADLKKTGKTIPQGFDNCTVYFSDIVNFTNTSATMDPVALIGELSDIFTTFDAIMERHGCERIKTIGDAYMAVCGMPVPNENHSENMVNAALEILEALHARNATHDIQWRIRIGINSGSIVGGVVGVKKYIYDVFGDTINTASRMESNSEPMRINCSSSTHALIHEKYETEARQPIEVKGKGIQEMFFINQKLS